MVIILTYKFLPYKKIPNKKTLEEELANSPQEIKNRHSISGKEMIIVLLQSLSLFLQNEESCDDTSQV